VAEASTGRLGTVGLQLVSGHGGAWIERDGVEGERVSPRGDVTWRRFEIVGEGWVAAGSYSDRSQTPTRDRLLVVLGSASGEARVLPEPTSDANSNAGIQRGWPVPIVQGDSLRGLAWLEGEGARSLAVRAAAWTGKGWSDSVTISPPAAGTQTALSGTTLPDGRAVLAWSAFDGTDDEILWSVGFGSLWTAPENLHAPNDRPDVIPALVAVGDRVLAAWSRLDEGDYRLKIAEWTARGWVEFDWQGGRGSLFPEFVRHDEGALLLYRTTVPSEWSLAEVEWGQGVLREASVEVPVDSPLAVRPSVDLAQGLALVWSGTSERKPERRAVQWRTP